MGVIIILSLLSVIVLFYLYSKNNTPFLRYQQVYVPAGIFVYCLIIQLLKAYSFFGFLSRPINYVLSKTNLSADWKVAIIDYLISLLAIFGFIKLKDFFIRLFINHNPSMSDLGWSKRFYSVYQKQVYLKGEFYYLTMFARTLSYVFMVLVFASFFAFYFQSYFPSYGIFLLAIFLESFWYLNGKFRHLVHVEEKKKEQPKSDLIMLWIRYQEIWSKNVGIATNRSYTSPRIMDDIIIENDILIENFKNNQIFSVIQKKAVNVIQKKKNVIIFVPNLDYIVSDGFEATLASKELVGAFRNAIFKESVFHPLIAVFTLPTTQEDTQIYFTQIDAFLNLSFTSGLEEWLSNVRLSIFLEYDQTLLHSPESTVAASKLLNHYVGNKIHDYTSIVLAEERHNQQEAWESNLNIQKWRKKQASLSNNMPNRVYFIGWKREIDFEYGILEGDRENILPLYSLSYLPLSMNFSDHFIIPFTLPYVEAKENVIDKRASWTSQYDNIKSISPVTLETHLTEVVKVMDLPLSKQLIISVTDQKFNSPYLYKYYASHADQECLINIISPPHIAREYFWQFHDFFIIDPVEPLSYKLISNDPINIILALTEKLTKAHLTLPEIDDELKKFGNEVPNENTLERLGLLYKHINFNILSSPFFTSKFIHKERQLFTLAPSFKKELELYKDVIFEDDNKPLFSLNKNLYAAKYSIGQMVTFLGRLYEINSIRETQNGHLKVAIDSRENQVPLFYKNIKEVNLKQINQIYFKKEDRYKFVKKLLAVSYEVTNKAYYQYEHVPNFKSKKDYSIINIDTGDNPNAKRSYPLGRAVVLNFSVHPDGGSSSLALQTLIIFVEEYLKILFPDSYDLLIIRPILEGDFVSDTVMISEIPNFYQFNNIVGIKDCNFGLVILEDSLYDLGHTQSIYENIDYVFRTIQDLLLYHRDHPDSCHYLKFGFNSYKEIAYDIEGAIKLTEKIVQLDTNEYRHKTKRTDDKVKEKEKVVDINEACDFCGSRITKSNEGDVLEDGRFICSSCKDKSIDDAKFFELIEEAKEFYLEEWGIDNWPVNLKFRLASAKEIMSYYPEKGFNPTEEYDFRYMGLAIQDGSNYLILIESHKPEEGTLITLIHELCHIYQYTQLDHLAMEQDFGKLYIEGHARWTEMSFVRSSRCEQRFPHISPESYEQMILTVDSTHPEYAEGYALITTDARKIGYNDLHKYLLSKYRRTTISGGYMVIVG